MKTACHGRWQREYESKTPFTTIPRKRTLLEAFLHQDPSEQVEDESHLDTLSIPAMSTECERVFSSSKKLLSPQRCRIKEDLIEASECLKAWWDCGMIVQ
jgi:hypothetical protein